MARRAIVGNLGCEFWRVGVCRPSRKRIGLRIVSSQGSYELWQRFCVGAQPDFDLCSAHSHCLRTGVAFSSATRELGTAWTTSSLLRSGVFNRAHYIARHDAVCILGCASWKVRFGDMEFADPLVPYRMANVSATFLFQCRGRHHGHLSSNRADRACAFVLREVPR